MMVRALSFFFLSPAKSPTAPTAPPNTLVDRRVYADAGKGAGVSGPSRKWSNAHTTVVCLTPPPTTTHLVCLSVPAAINEKERLLTTAVRTAKAPAAEATYEAFHALANAQFNKTKPGECKASVKASDGLPLSFAFQGSGNLLIYYQGWFFFMGLVEFDGE